MQEKWGIGLVSHLRREHGPTVTDLPGPSSIHDLAVLILRQPLKCESGAGHGEEVNWEFDPNQLSL